MHGVWTLGYARCVDIGDFVKNNGSGGESVFGKKFRDDPAGLKVSE